MFESFADTQNVSFAPVSEKNQDYFVCLWVSPLGFFSPEGSLSPQVVPDASVGVFHIRTFMPRVSFMKAMGLSALSAGLSAGVTGGAYVTIVTPTGMPHSTALLFDNESGEE